MNYILAAAITSMLVLAIWINPFKQQKAQQQVIQVSAIAQKEASAIEQGYQAVLAGLANGTYSPIVGVNGPLGITDLFGCQITAQTIWGPTGIESIGVVPVCSDIAAESSALAQNGITNAQQMASFLEQVGSTVMAYVNGHGLEAQYGIPASSQAYLWDGINQAYTSLAIQPVLVFGQASSIPSGWFSPTSPQEQSTYAYQNISGGNATQNYIPTGLDTLSQATVQNNALQFGIWYGIMNIQADGYEVVTAQWSGVQGGYSPPTQQSTNYQYNYTPASCTITC